MLRDFKEFAMKGNLVDMAVGIVMGAAFGTVIKSLVSDMMMPMISSVFSVPDFANIYSVLESPEGVNAAGMSLAAFREAGGVAFAYGAFINALIAFILVAFALWLVVRAMNRMKKAEEEAPAGPTQEDLLGEIRDLLAKK